MLHLLIADLSFPVSVCVVDVDDWCDCRHEGLRLPDVSNLNSQVATIWYSVSGTTFFTEDINLHKISCRPTEDYSKRSTKWQLANLEVACRIDVTLTDDWKGKRLGCGTLEHDLLSTDLREGYTQTAKLVRLRLCAFQRQEQALFPKGIV